MKSLILFSLFLNLIYKSESKEYTPVVIAHRGASGYLPEHTLESKALAFMMEADYIEQDVVLTKDDVPIVLHDIYLDQVTNVAEKFKQRSRNDSRYYAIDFYLREIKTLQVTERFRLNSTQVYPLRFPMGKSTFQMNTLEEEIELLQGLEKSFNAIHSLDKTLANKRIYKAGIYVEIKDPQFHKRENKANFSEIVLSVLSRYGYRNKNDKAIVQCFDPVELSRIRNELKSNLTLVQLLEANQVMDGFDWTSKDGLERIAKYADGIGPEKDQLINYDEKVNLIQSSQLYRDAKSLGLFMHPYTFRIDSLPRYSSKNYNQLLNLFFKTLKVDGLFTDFPDLTLQYLKNSQCKLKHSFFLTLVFLFISFLFIFQKI